MENKPKAPMPKDPMPKDPRGAREEPDDFWDIDDLIPRRTLPRRSTAPSPVEISLEPVESSPSTAGSRPIPKREAEAPPSEKERSEPVRHYLQPHFAEEEARAKEADEVYSPADSLIETVRIRRRKSGYPYYESFYKDAARLYPVKGEECAQVPFFSYVPQYNQMSRQQLEWYLWWRENFRHGTPINTDYSYLLLYAYEVINLSDRIEPTLARSLLFRLWSSYRETFHQLDGYLPDWIVDLCLLHRLPPPEELDAETLPAIMSHSVLREFYPVSNGEAGYFRALLVFASNYNYRKSKFCTEENRPLFDRVILGAVRAFCESTGKDGKPFHRMGADRSMMTREAFAGALCSSHIKCRISVEYASFSCSHALRFVLTDVIKYTENRIRVYLGVRARLTVYELSVATKRMLDAYLDEALPKKESAPERQEAIPEYEKLYDLPRSDFSPALAERIEAASWDTTKRLLEAFEEEKPEEVPPIPAEPVPLPKEGPAPAEGAAVPYPAILAAYARGDRAAAEALCRAAGLFPDAVADAINAAAVELTGDVFLEETDAGYVLIEDYRETVEALVSRAEGV